MNLEVLEKIAKAVLYEGYMLYPYRPSAVKNQQRWNFGVLYPRSYSEAQSGPDAWMMQTECIVEGSLLSALEVKVRFLQLVMRSVGQPAAPVRELQPGEKPEFQLVRKLVVDGKIFQPWQEAVEREVSVPVLTLSASGQEPFVQRFTFSREEQVEPVRDKDGRIAGIIIRQRQLIGGAILVSVEAIGDELFKVSVDIRNETPVEIPGSLSREEALLRSFASTHTMLGVQDGTFVSMVDPPAALRDAASDCRNIGTWPVLVGEEGQRDTMLSSPIILYDHPQIAPESSGDLFDGTEIDEILSLRIMTLTDEEKREMRQSDERARRILERTETLPVEQLMKLHGALRGLRPIKEDAP